jgi:hypothetical protein
MDPFEYNEPDPQTKNFGIFIWNALTILVLASIACVAGGALMIFTNPYTPFNLFPPPAQAAQPPTLTPTPRNILPPTWTPLPSATPTVTSTPEPSATPNPISEATINPLSPTVTPQTSDMRFAVDVGSPVAISSLAFHPEAGCNWLSVAGQVLNASGAPVSTGVVIYLGGSLDGRRMDIPSLTGVAPQFGPSGYEILLADYPAASKDSLWVQLLDQAGVPMSDKVYFSTFEDCTQNLIIINFKQVQ